MLKLTSRQVHLLLTSKRFFGAALVLLSVLTTGTTFAQNAGSSLSTSVGNKEKSEIKNLIGTWTFSISNTQFKDEYNQRNMTAAEVGVDLNYKVTSSMLLKFNPRFAYETGYLQTDSESAPSKSSWTAKEASANFSPVEYVEISAGALNQSALHSKLLLDDIAFPAARLTLQTSAKNRVRFGLKAQTAVATSSSLSTETGEFEQTPTFQSAGLFVEGKWPRAKFSLRANHFAFKNLPASLATESGFLGNTVTDLSNDLSEFTHQYKGYELAAAAHALLGRFSYQIKGGYVKNTEVEKELSDGFVVENIVGLRVHREWTLSPSYEYFKVAPDAAVARYNAASITTNRVGYRAGIYVEMLKNFKASIKAGERDVVFVNPAQSREKTLDLALETLNVPF